MLSDRRAARATDRSRRSVKRLQINSIVDAAAAVDVFRFKRNGRQRSRGEIIRQAKEGRWRSGEAGFSSRIGALTIDFIFRRFLQVS